MKGGRLKIVNESRYPTSEVEELVRFGLQEIELTRERIVALVKNTKQSARRSRPPGYSGTAYSLRRGIPASLYDRYCGRGSVTDHLIVLRLGPPDVFPESQFRRYSGQGKDEFRDWREALVAITAHEGMHAQHSYDGGYREKSGSRQVRVPSFEGDVGGYRIVEEVKTVRVRVGSERIEPKCEAHELFMLRRYREASA